MVKIINNQNSIKSFSLRFTDLNNVIVKTVTESEYPISKEMQIAFTEDDYGIMDNKLVVKLSITYKDNKTKYVESTNFDATATDMEITVFDSTKKPNINMSPKAKLVTRNVNEDKTYTFVKAVFDDYAKKNKDILTAKENAELSREYATQALNNSRQAEQFRNQAFTSTPEGYEAVAEKVIDLDLVSERGNSFIRPNTSKGKCLINKIYGMSEQSSVPSTSNPIEIKDVNVSFVNKGKNLVYFPHSGRSKNHYPFTYTTNGITYTFKEDGTIILNGTATIESAININTPYNWDLANKLIKGATYYITDGRENENTRHPNGYVQFVLVSEDDERVWAKSTADSEGTAIASYTNNGQTDEKFNRWGVRVVVSAGATCNNVVVKPMVSLSQDTTYELGNPNENITTSIVLRALEVEPNDTYNFVKNGKYYIADTLEESENGYEIIRRVGHKVFNGSENWSKADTEVADKYRKTLILNDIPSYAQLCTTTTARDKKGYVVSSAYPEEMTNDLLHPYKCAQTIALHDTNHWIQIYDERYNKVDDLEQWKAHLAEEPLVVNYRLYKTIVEPISVEDMEKLCNLISSDNYTTLELASDVDTDMEVMIPYSKTTAKALEGNVQSKLNASKLLELQTALLEMGSL